jgi:hypothetical protein
MRWTAWSSLAAVGLLAAGMLAAVPKELADARGDPGLGAPPPGVLTRPPAQQPPAINLDGESSSEIATATGSDPDNPFLDTDVARLRIKQFVTEAYAPASGGREPATDQLSLDEALAQIDALSPEQVDDIDARLGPFVWVSRGFAMRTTERDDDGEASLAQETDPEALRQELDAYLVRLEPYAPMARGNAIVYANLVTEMRQAVAAMTEEDLYSLIDLFANVPSARAMLGLDPATILGAPPVGSGATTTGGPGRSGSERLLAGSIHTNSACADMAFGTVVTAVLTSVANTASDVAALLSDDYMVSTFNIPNPAKIIANSIALPLKLLALAAQADINYFVNCNEGAHQVLFTEHDEEMSNRTGEMASLLDDASRQSDLKRILANRMERIDTFNSEFRDLTLRLAIEKDLLRHGDPRIAMFQVPASMCVTVGEHRNCGQLETVRDIVADTILMNRSAGFNTTLASTALTDGDDQQALGLYKAAYTRYRYAYQLAVRSGY